MTQGFEGRKISPKGKMSSMYIKSQFDASLMKGLGISQHLASSYNGAAVNSTANALNHESGGGGRVTSKTAPARLEQLDDEDDEDNILFKVLPLW